MTSKVNGERLLHPFEAIHAWSQAGLNIYASTNNLRKLFGCLKAFKCGSGNIMDSVQFFTTQVQWLQMLLILFKQCCYVRTMSYFTFFLYLELNQATPLNIIETNWKSFLMVLHLYPLLKLLFN